MMFVMIVVYLHIFMEKCVGDTKYHNSAVKIDNVCEIVLLSVLWTVLRHRPRMEKSHSGRPRTGE